ncbi:2-oxoacid:acceptor oxidoreductase subunit alpha [Candidatus Thorarchaeota archaeon]|jgi:2-oxoglutarate ferredoxin oxidoreductase subunit alpha|nr:MAG: 2-oxoacid:acceptor oxidoreductase subunit alpha [Candidatus Thorarchaeota archaeon]
MSPNTKSVNFWQGNHACAEAAIAAGCRFFAGYPITPASEIAEIMSQQLPRLGGTYIQMEDEIAAISAVIGGAWGGSLSMTATSGPGFSLMQENIGYAIMTETPCVIVDVQRAGPSTGQATKAAQGDLMQARWGTHGDHEMIVLAPNSSQETYELTIKAFSLSEKLRHPVILLSDEVVGHSREKVVVDSRSDNRVSRILAKIGDPPYGGVNSDGHALMPRFGDGHNLLITGSTHNEQGFRKTSDSDAHDKLIRRITSKIQEAGPILDDFVISGPENAEWGIISFGSTSRSVEELMVTEGSQSNVRTMRLRTVWPFPDQAVRDFSKTVDTILVPELNLGQLSREISRVVRDTIDVVSLNKIGGGRMIEPDEILAVMTQ